jgi:hypothetical protein
VIDLARQRLADLQNIVKTRLAAADPSLSEALELMSFLTNLVGSQHVERFVPIAEPERERQLEAAAATKRKPSGATSTSTVVKPGRPAPKQKSAAKAAKPPNDTTVTAVVKDAARLLSWGRDWHELPEAIARIAGRPGIQQVRQILRSSKSAIEQRIAAQDKH